MGGRFQLEEDNMALEVELLRLGGRKVHYSQVLVCPRHCTALVCPPAHLFCVLVVCPLAQGPLVGTRYTDPLVVQALP